VILFNVNNTLLLKLAVSLKKKHEIKLVADVRTLPVQTNRMNRYISDKLFGINLRYAAHWFDGITYITERMRRFCTSNYNLPLHTSSVWASGVNPELFSPETYALHDEPLKFLYHGSISRTRGLDNVVKAASLLSDIDLTIHFLGWGDAMNELRELANELGVQGKIEFLNSMEYNKVANWINGGHVGILPFPDWPGWNTSSPIKLFEYLSCGKPVVVTDIPAHRDVLDGKEFAFWVEESTPEAIAQAMRRAYDERWRFQALGKAARDFIMAHHTWEQQSRRLTDFLDRILKSE
jgi:glycosyltransferase involved in cell wall biosynthesis